MTFPALVFGFFLALFLGSLFYLIKDGGPLNLLYSLVVSCIGFWIGHQAGELLGVTFFTLGALNLGAAFSGSVVFLFLGYVLVRKK